MTADMLPGRSPWNRNARRDGDPGRGAGKFRVDRQRPAAPLVLAVFLCCTGVVGGAEVTPVAAETPADTALATSPRIPGFERFFASAEAPVADGGRLLLGELNCTSCHRPDEVASASLSPKQAPVLTGAGARIRPEYVRKFLSDPHRAKPGTTMPDVLSGLDETERRRQVEALTHFLASTGVIREAVPVPSAAASGEALFHRVGCAVCHGSQRKDAARLATSVPLAGVDTRYTIPSLAQFLRNPHAVRPSGRMPSLNLEEREAGDIAAYLLRDIEVTPNVEYKWYAGNWQKLPDFDTLTPQGSGKSAGFDLSVSGKQQQWGVRFQTNLLIEHEGEYTFHLGSDDGARLALSKHTIILNDGTHPFSFRPSGRIRLRRGIYYVTVDYFQAGGGQELRVEYEGPQTSRRPLSSDVTLDKKSVPGMEHRFQVSAELALEGRRIFQRAGCASCHQLDIDGKRIKSQLVARPLAELTASRGCLAPAVPSGLPAWQLTDMQRMSLEKGLASIASGAPYQRVQHLLTTFNCFACHQRGEIGGVEQARNSLFETTIPEMGDEGRIPPTLDGVGDKLQLAWLKHVMDTGANDRPYMLTRMPKFGSSASVLAQLLSEQDRQKLVDIRPIEQPPLRVQAIGRHLAGANGLSCIKCHYVGKFAATGIQAMDLTTMTRRLREDWFQRYMINPQVYRRGTRMPSAFPGGRSILPDILDDDAQAQLRAMWVYLSLGANAPVPAGLMRQAIELVPEKEPIIYRNFIAGVGPRAIAVGYPERASLAWDADSMRPALIWHNAFLDASRHWTGRGQGFQQPLGDHVLSLPEGPSLALLSDADTAWPTASAREQGFRFLGYRLDRQQRPVFRYRFTGWDVEDTFIPVPGTTDTGFRRTLTLKRSPAETTGTSSDGTSDESAGELWLRAATGNIEAFTAESSADDSAGWLVDGILKIRLAAGDTAGKAVLRKAGNEFELLFPLNPTDGTATIVQTYHW